MYSSICSNKSYYNKLHVSVTLNNNILSSLAFDLEITESKYIKYSYIKYSYYNN